MHDSVPMLTCMSLLSASFRISTILREARQHCESENLLSRRSAFVVQLAVRHGIPGLGVHPAQSCLFLLPGVTVDLTLLPFDWTSSHQKRLMVFQPPSLPFFVQLSNLSLRGYGGASGEEFRLRSKTSSSRCMIDFAVRSLAMSIVVWIRGGAPLGRMLRRQLRQQTCVRSSSVCLKPSNTKKRWQRAAWKRCWHTTLAVFLCGRLVCCVASCAMP